MMFKFCMKSNSKSAMKGDLPLNPVTRLWQKIDTSPHLRFQLSEYMKIAELVVVMVLGSVEDERTFSTLSFMKNKLQNRLSTHLPTVVAMHVQPFYTINNFAYNSAFEH